MSILAQQLRRPNIKPKWHATLGVMESVVAYNCRKHGFPIPILAMPFWEGAGNKVYDVSGKGNHGSLINGANWSKSKFGNCISLDGINDYIVFSDDNLPIGANPRSIEFWIKRNSGAVFGDYKFLYSYGTRSTYNAFSLYGYIGTNNIYFQGYAYDFDTGIDLADTNWHHIAITFNGTYVKAYENGLLISTTDRNLLNTISGVDNFVLGGVKIDGRYWDGMFDGFKIYNLAITSDQVKFLYNNPYFMYEMPEELWGYTSVTNILNSYFYRYIMSGGL